MSKGGAGKVYFILYLAVLLELLIIIVERDDAEEELRKEKLALEAKTKRIQLIAETIINSLRGSATSVSSTSNQSMILGDEKEAAGREFNVRVRVADPIRDSVKELDLHILRNANEVATINLAIDPQANVTRSGQDYIYKYMFKPQWGEGQYTLRFDARTNQIVGVTPSASANDTVKIGNVRLTVAELREVKDNITENVGLRSYIDSLLTGDYQNFSSNLGSNEFLVDVKKKEAKVTDQLSIYPQVTDFAAFPGLALQNPIKIEGAEAKTVTLTKTDGVGELKKIDTNWYWVWTPDAGLIAQNYTIKFKGQANRGGGAKDVASGAFSVTVNKLEPVGAFYVPNPEKAVNGNKPPFTGVPFKVNAKMKGLDGTYRIEMFMNGAKVKESNEPTIDWTAELLKDEGKELEVKTYFQSPYMNAPVMLKDDKFKIDFPPLQAGQGLAEIHPGENFDFKAALGVSGSPYIKVGGDLTVESDGYFETKAKKVGDFDFTMRLSAKANNVREKDGHPVTIVLTDPRTGQSTSIDTRVMQKVTQKGNQKGPRNRM